MSYAQEKVDQIRQRVADTLGDGTHVALTQAIPGMLEVCKLSSRGHAQVMEAARGTVVGHGCRERCSAHKVAGWVLQGAQQGVSAAGTLLAIIGSGSDWLLEVATPARHGRRHGRRNLQGAQCRGRG